MDGKSSMVTKFLSSSSFVEGLRESFQHPDRRSLVKSDNLKSNSRRLPTTTPIIDSDACAVDPRADIEYMSAGYRSRRDAMLYFRLVPHHGWHRSIPANDFLYDQFLSQDRRFRGIALLPLQDVPAAVKRAVTSYEKARHGSTEFCRQKGLPVALYSS